jgi:hypothetical protein
MAEDGGGQDTAVEEDHPQAGPQEGAVGRWGLEPEDVCSAHGLRGQSPRMVTSPGLRTMAMCRIRYTASAVTDRTARAETTVACGVVAISDVGPTAPTPPANAAMVAWT